ncbi:MAG: VanZ family protein, partial [Clostridiaceae bacterium]
LEYIVRKNAHAFEYFILAILTGASFFSHGIRGRRAVVYILVFCLFYAATDEFHQLFVSGRSAMFTDVVIDFSGAAMGTVLFYIGYYTVWIKRKQEYKTADKMTG